MATRTGGVGTNGQDTFFKNAQSIGITMQAGEYPVSISLSLVNGPRWRNLQSNQLAIRLYLCSDNAWTSGTWTELERWNIPGNSTQTNHNSWTLSATEGKKLLGKTLYLRMYNTNPAGTGWDTCDYTPLQHRAVVTVETAYDKFNITCYAGTGGSLTASATSALSGSEVTLYPVPNTGYQLSSWSTSPTLTITNNKFIMPQQAVTITANFSKINYSITKGANPSAGGTVTVASTAQYSDQVSISQTPASGYYFNGWTTSPALTISSGKFSMPAQNVSITANYLRRSTATLNSSTLTGGSTVTLTISTDSTAYSHKYKLSFGSNMETSLTNVAAGTTSVSISIPDSWSNQIPNATTKGSGTLLLETYSGSTKIGEYTITGLTYAVKTSAVPTIGTITNSIVRTIGSVTYANVGDYYIQNHSGVRVQTSASGALGSTISSLKVSLNGYSGSSYVKTVTTGSIDFTTGLLTTAGTQTITVNVTDSRGRTASKTATITVTAYNKPSGALSVWRVNSGGSVDDMGEYGKFSITKSYSAIGSNSLTRKLASPGYSAVTLSADTGDILPGSRKTFSIQQEYTITLTLQDAFETTTITEKLRSASFIIYASANGKKLGFMKAANKGAATAKTIEFDGDSTIYIGDRTLAEYIRYIING